MQGSALTSSATPQGSSQDDVIDAAVLCLCSYDRLMKHTDLRKVRLMLAQEMERAPGGPLHLTPLFVYLWAVAKPWYATGEVMACVRELATMLQQRGVLVRLPDAYRCPSRSRAQSARHPLARTPTGTRASSRERRLPEPARDG